jgi:ribosomal protein S18 acetylase RimI-like enzyme
VPNAEFTIAPAEVSDAADIHTVKMRAFAEEGRLSGTRDLPPLQEDLAAVERDIRTHTVLIVRADGRTVGSARGQVSGTSCEIRAVCVDPSYQGRGIGAALVRAIEEAYPDVEQFELTTNTLVPGNVEFYERHGYEVVGRTTYTDTIVLAHLIKTMGPATAS